MPSPEAFARFGRPFGPERGLGKVHGGSQLEPAALEGGGQAWLTGDPGDPAILQVRRAGGRLRDVTVRAPAPARGR